MQFVEIDTKAFSGTVVSIKDMPGSRVVSVFATEGPAQMFKTLKLFKLAQMGDALDQWMAKSMHSKEDGSNDNAEAKDDDFN
jgi:hypothetical protein